MVAPLTIGGGIEIGGGISIGAAGGGGGGANGVVTFAEMTATGNIQQWLQGSANATMNANGFTLGAISGVPGQNNGVAIASLTANNQAFFSTYGTGNRTATWAAGSTYSSPMTVNLLNNSGSTIVFFMNDVVSFPATFVFPITFS
jgi:hypothetical protein